MSCADGCTASTAQPTTSPPPASPPPRGAGSTRCTASWRVPDEWVDNPDEDPAPRLRDYREDLACALQGGRAAHPALRAFGDVARGCGMAADEPLCFLDAMAMDLNVARYPTYAHLETYMRGSAAAVGMMMCDVLGAGRRPPRCAPPPARWATRCSSRTFSATYARTPSEAVCTFRRTSSPRSAWARTRSSRARCRTASGGSPSSRSSGRAGLYAQADGGIPMLPPEARKAVRLARVLYARILDRDRGTRPRRVRRTGADLEGREDRGGRPGCSRAGASGYLPFAMDGRIGVDESGKGDFFGPLVVAACYVGPEHLAELDGVPDSKKLTDAQALRLSDVIARTCPHAVISIGPEKYNELYANFKNLNHLLAWGHARAIENVLEIQPADLVISDQFAAGGALVRRALFERGAAGEVRVPGARGGRSGGGRRLDPRPCGVPAPPEGARAGGRDRAPQRGDERDRSGQAPRRGEGSGRPADGREDALQDGGAGSRRLIHRRSSFPTNVSGVEGGLNAMRRPRAVLGTLAGAALLALGAALLWRTSDLGRAAADLGRQEAEARREGVPIGWADLRRLTPSVPDAENAAPLYAQGFAEFHAVDGLRIFSDALLDRAVAGTAKPEDRERIDRTLAIDARALALVVEGSRRRSYHLDHAWERGPRLLFPEFADGRQAARALVLRAVRGEDSASTARDLRAAARLAAAAESEPILLSPLVGARAEREVEKGMVAVGRPGRGVGGGGPRRARRLRAVTRRAPVPRGRVRRWAALPGRGWRGSIWPRSRSWRREATPRRPSPPLCASRG